MIKLRPALLTSAATAATTSIWEQIVAMIEPMPDARFGNIVLYAALWLLVYRLLNWLLDWAVPPGRTVPAADGQPTACTCDPADQGRSSTEGR
ncbi:hypothetical protein LADH09A_001954 [Micromonospora sp. LAH09]|uniref:hypothetical protein n=1 Tax=Micromonospora cabrerizensis TaxID=2911213 RepID=UPI001EE8D203|nr:hypothetical protein [Micromonospora cabrerizensis]MCG5468097.1 hypothetical protein [Micromonospora cabrerizensis]